MNGPMDNNGVSQKAKDLEFERRQRNAELVGPEGWSGGKLRRSNGPLNHADDHGLFFGMIFRSAASWMAENIRKLRLSWLKYVETLQESPRCSFPWKLLLLQPSSHGDMATGTIPSQWATGRPRTDGGSSLQKAICRSKGANNWTSPVE